MSYTPGPAQPRNLEELWRYLQAELGKIQRAFTDLEALAPLYREPPRRPPLGLLVTADGTDWDPGQGKGLYIWEGSAWVQVHAL
ncbi:hypothetical protein [Microbulbifer sp. JMSA008]|uniref:hypothetical protein n=1 Tax=Microbulbifer sp. JMSA008 TaxID=3243373 RepID=UPI00403973B4